MSERLQKYMAACGVASRRKCEDLIAGKRVKVNGQTVTTPGTCIDPKKDEVQVDDKIIRLPEEFSYYKINKPKGIVVTVSDSHGQKTIIDLVEDVEERVFPVGRLDMDTEGLLILTNDGELANRMIHPRYHLEKEYLISVKKPLGEHNRKWLEKGIILDDRKTAPAQIMRMRKSGGLVKYKMIMREGRKRQIRRMFKAVGRPVINLKRTAVGPIRLGRLEPGEYRALTRRELGMLKKAIAERSRRPRYGKSPSFRKKRGAKKGGK